MQLNPAQAKVRAHQLRPVGEGIFEILQPIEFKAGEILGFDGEVNARLLQNITPIAVKDSETPETSAPPVPPVSEKEKSKKK